MKRTKKRKTARRSTYVTQKREKKSKWEQHNLFEPEQLTLFNRKRITEKESPNPMNMDKLRRAERAGKTSKAKPATLYAQQTEMFSSDKRAAKTPCEKKASAMRHNLFKSGKGVYTKPQKPQRKSRCK